MLLLNLKQGEGVDVIRGNKVIGRIHCKHLSKTIATMSFDLPASLQLVRDTAKNKQRRDRQ